jgi:tetratricopeptide (TPR) repeat protein
MRVLSSLVVVAACLQAATSVGAAEDRKSDPEAAQLYQHCIALARTEPQEGWHEALAWSSMEGGEPAHHCAAIALISMRQFAEGATQLEALAEASQSAAVLRAGMLAQAGQAWLLDRQPDRAFRAQSKALLLVPGAPDLLVDRAQSQADEQNYQGALQDLDLALQATPDRSDALTFRATAKRHLGDVDGDRADIAAALKCDDRNEDAWLEDGIERSLAGDFDGARNSWQKVLELAPQSEAAGLARRDLESLDRSKG